VAIAQRLARAGNVTQHHVQRRARDEFAAGDRIPRLGAGSGQDGDRGVQVGQRQHRRDLLARAREQLQHRGGDDAQRAFRAAEQVAQIVAGVVFAQATQHVQDATVGQDDL
jgi:hypothetical protein